MRLPGAFLTRGGAVDDLFAPRALAVFTGRGTEGALLRHNIRVFHRVQDPENNSLRPSRRDCLPMDFTSTRSNSINSSRRSAPLGSMINCIESTPLVAQFAATRRLPAKRGVPKQAQKRAGFKSFAT